MARQNILDMTVAKIYALLLQKVERKGRTKDELDQLILWLTGYRDIAMIQDLTYGEFIGSAPCWNDKADLIKGTICGVRVEEIKDPVMKKVRQLDKLVDELAKGKPIDKVIRGDEEI